MKRLISILVLVAMMLTSFAATISAIADEITDGAEGGDGGDAVVETEKVYNVNWKELVEDGTMRSQWAYERQPGQNNMSSKYNITATETAISIDKDGKSGDHRQYYSDVMFDLNADTLYEYELEVKSISPDGDGGFIFAFGANPNGRIDGDNIIDIYGNKGGTVPVAAYFLNGKLNTGSAAIKFGGGWGGYGYEDGKDYSQNLTDIFVSEDGYSKYKIVYTGLTVELFYLDKNDAWVELYADKEITLAEGVQLAFGIYAWSTDWANIRNCVVTAKSAAAVAAINAAFSTDLTAFNAELATAEAFAQADWLNDDWATFAASVAAAKAEVAATKYQYQVDRITPKVTDAVKKLTATKANIKPTLEAMIAVADEIVAVPENQALYTETSWGRMTAALEAAKAVVADEAATQAAMVAAYNVLNAAKKGLLTVELAAKNVYNVNWKYLVTQTTMKAQWCFDASEGQNNWDAKFTTYATENSIYAKPIGNGDVRQYYSTDMMFDITENTYYEYVFSAKNDPNRPTGYAGVVIGWAIDNDAYIENGDKGAWKGDIMSAYFLYGAFQNKSDEGDCFDLGLTYGYRSTGKSGDNPNYTVDTAAGENLGNGTGVAKLDADGYATYKVIYDGYNVTVLYLAEDDTFKPVFGDKVAVFAEGAKVALGIYNRNEGRNIYVKDAVLTSYNEAAAETIVNTAKAVALAKAEARIAEGIYTPVSVQRVKDAIAALNALTAEATAAEVDAAIAAIEVAITRLNTAEKTALIAAIDAANAAIADKTAADFVEKYYTPFAAALATAIEVRDNEDADQTMVDDALAALENTFKYLTPAGQACKVDLVAILAVYAELVETDYKPSSWATLATPFATANGLNENAELTDADQDAIDAAVVALDEVIKALVKRANFKTLKAAYDRALTLDADDYKNWAEAGVDAAVATALATLENLELDQADVDAALAALNLAVDALITWRTNVLAIKPADDYEVVDKEKYPDPSWYNKITDMSYNGFGNVFYYDYHKLVATKAADGFEFGKQFPQPLDKLNLQGNGDYVLRLGTNMSGSGTNRVTDGVKEGGTDLEHRAAPTYINGTRYAHVFGFSFLKAPTVDSIAFYLPTNTTIVSIDVYGAVIETLADGTKLYGKADKADVVVDDNNVLCEDSTTAKKVYLGTVNVPAAAEGASNIYVAADFVQAMKVDYIYFAIKTAEGTGNNAYYFVKEVELFGLNEGETVNEKAAPDFTAVNAAMSAFYNCVEADYTVESWAKVITTIAQYANVIANLKADQADVTAAAAAIDAAVKALIANPADWTALDAIIGAGSSITADAYTPKTFDPFKAVYDAAVALRNSSNVPQTAINKIVAELTAKYDALAKRADFTALLAALEEAKKLVKEEWNGNAIAWKMFENSIKAAEEFLLDVNTTQEEVDKVAADLVSRRADLVKVEKPADPTQPSNPSTETEAPKDTETEAPKATESESAKATETEAPKADEGCGGCGSSAALSAIAIVSVIGTAVALKKKED